MKTPEDLFWFLVFLVLLAVSFLPSILAFKNRHSRRWLIFAVNLFLGGLPLGFIVAWVLYARDRSFRTSGTSPSTAESLPCPSCGRFYDPSDYRDDAVEIGCSYCGAIFPHPEPGSHAA